MRRTEMNKQTQISIPARHGPGRTGAVMGFPDDVLRQAGLSLAEKRAILAAWASDACAVEDRPGLRRLDNGAVVAVGEILDALRSLDRPGQGENPRERRPLLVRRAARFVPGWRKAHRDDDDDPPPCPAAAMPMRVALAAELAA